MNEIIANNILGKMLKEKRTEAGFNTQKELAEYYNLSIDTVKGWECGKTLPGRWIWNALRDKCEANKHEKLMNMIEPFEPGN